MSPIEGTGDSLNGQYGETIDYRTQPTVDELIKKGYELVSDGFTESGKTFNDGNKGKGLTQKYFSKIIKKRNPYNEINH